MSTNNDKSALFGPQSETKLIKVRGLAAAIKREYDISDAADETAIEAIVAELAALVAGA